MSRSENFLEQSYSETESFLRKNNLNNPSEILNFIQDNAKYSNSQIYTDLTRLALSISKNKEKTDENNQPNVLKINSGIQNYIPKVVILDNSEYILKETINTNSLISSETDEYKSTKSLIENRLTTNKAKDGQIQITLIWSNGDDLDLHVFDPNNEEIYYNNKKSKSGGELDIEMNAGYTQTTEPIENIIWTNEPLYGTYKVYVNYYAVHTKNGGKTNYKVKIKYNNEEKYLMGEISYPNKKFIYQFYYNENNKNGISNSNSNSSIIQSDQDVSVKQKTEPIKSKKNNKHKIQPIYQSRRHREDTNQTDQYLNPDNSDISSNTVTPN